jgi:hypothetical protein
MRMTTTLLTAGLMSFSMSCGYRGDTIATGHEGHSGNEVEALATELAKGWNTWNTRSVLSHVLLPEGLAINLQLEDGRSGDLLEEALIGRSEFDSMEHVTPGPHADDGSYTELELEWRGIHVRVQSAAIDRELYMLVTPLDSSPGDSLIVDPQMMWDREGEIEINRGVITGKTATEVVEVNVRGERAPQVSGPIEVSLTEAISLSTDATSSIEEIAELVDAARVDHLSEKSSFEGSSELFDAVQTVLAWNVIYEPTHDRVITPVSRVWSVGWKGWILFEWDTYFAAYMHSMNNKELAYANALAMTNEITDRGFVPNFASSVTTSEDRSEPPVGSFVVKEIYRKYREDWFLRECGWLPDLGL